jgi:hypothetical protein
MMDGFGLYDGGWLIGMGMMIFFWVAVILLVIWAVHHRRELKGVALAQRSAHKTLPADYPERASQRQTSV